MSPDRRTKYKKGGGKLFFFFSVQKDYFFLNNIMSLPSLQQSFEKETNLDKKEPLFERSSNQSFFFSITSERTQKIQHTCLVILIMENIVKLICANRL